MASAITALFTFIGNYLQLFPQKGTQPFLTEILKISIERVFVPISLSRTGLVTAVMILMFCGLTGKRNFWMSLTFMLTLARIKKAPWINSELKKGMRDLDATKRKAMASNDPRDWANYKKLRNTINNNIKTSKASYYSNAFSQSRGISGKTWQTINELTSRRTNNTTVKELKFNGSIISNSSEFSNAFNDHFSAIGPRLCQ